ncbi:MAG: Flp family type IVb pilin [Abitibacteriaceae bacterium]|nr:Flp family type IVb pilin [Abditibacteriaceae bacterium]MBV9868854.1 Flp family type IVb pilin [Abditibacteriaceae bacterium]
MIKQFFVEEEGQTLVEYGLLIGMIALVLVGVLTIMGGKLQGGFSTAGNSINTTT